jgi:hypothetical protein
MTASEQPSLFVSPGGGHGTQVWLYLSFFIHKIKIMLMFCILQIGPGTICPLYPLLYNEVLLELIVRFSFFIIQWVPLNWITLGPR